MPTTSVATVIKLSVAMMACASLHNVAHAVSLPQCPQPQLIEQRYVAPQSNLQGYRNPLNALLAGLPHYHMVHDVISARGSVASITAKFDYGSIVHKDLEFETVQFYLRGAQDSQWRYLGQKVTNSDGKASITISGLATGQYRIYALVPADKTGAEGFITVVDPGTEAVLFDIDGTLTESDLEQVGDYPAIRRASPKDGAYSLVRQYLDKGYQPIYLSARVYWYQKGTRDWLQWMGLPPGFLRTSLSNETSLFRTAAYKIEQIKQLQAAGVNIVRAYGNAKTDAEAFIKAGLAADRSFTIGADAGFYGTTAITGNSYQQHIRQAVAPFPAARCY
jgi:phosphatidate phosphatase PAH1